MRPSWIRNELKRCNCTCLLAVENKELFRIFWEITSWILLGRTPLFHRIPMKPTYDFLLTLWVAPTHSTTSVCGMSDWRSPYNACTEKELSRMDKLETTRKYKGVLEFYLLIFCFYLELVLNPNMWYIVTNFDQFELLYPLEI